MKWLWLSILILTVAPVSFAQINHLDTIRQAMKLKPKFVVGLNNRYSLVSGEPIRVNGLQAGMDFNHQFKIYFGYNWMPISQISATPIPGHTDTLIESNKLSYVSLSAEYVFMKTRKWMFSVPLLLGIGNHQRVVKRTETNEPVVKTQFMMPVEFGASGVYYFTDWFGLRGGLGNRLGFGKSFSTTSGPYYSLGFTLFLGPLIDKAKVGLKG